MLLVSIFPTARLKHKSAFVRVGVRAGVLGPSNSPKSLKIKLYIEKES